MRETLALVLLCVGLASCELSPYKPRGWRPNGHQFNPSNERLTGYYGPPEASAHTPISTTTRRPATMRSTTTPRTREPTTSTSPPEEEFVANPAIAIANSFAFNRPVYIYNSFPFQPGQILLK